MARCIVSVDTRRSNDHGPNGATTAAIAAHGMGTGFLGQSSGGFHTHVLLEGTIQQTLNENAPTAARGKRHFETSATEGNVVDTAAIHFVPSRHNHAGTEAILIVVNQAAHQMGGRLYRRLTARR